MNDPKRHRLIGRPGFIYILPVCRGDDDPAAYRNFRTFAFPITDLQNPGIGGISRQSSFQNLLDELAALDFRIGQTVRGGRRCADGGEQTQRDRREPQPHFASSARRRTSAMCPTKWTLSLARTSAGTSSQSDLFCSGKRISLMPKRDAASTFSLTPPTRKTRPRRLISPVIAIRKRTHFLVINDASAATIATPALGPSFGVAPAGTWMWMSNLL